MALKTDYKDYIHPASGLRYVVTPQGDGTSKIDDATQYTQEGDVWGASIMDTTNQEVNNLVESGTWTPYFYGGTTAGAFTYSTQDGRYTRTGNLVHMGGNIVVSSVNALPSGTLNIGGIPFSAAHGTSVQVTYATGGTQNNLRTVGFSFIAEGNNNIQLQTNTFSTSLNGVLHTYSIPAEEVFPTVGAVSSARFAFSAVMPIEV